MIRLRGRIGTPLVQAMLVWVGVGALAPLRADDNGPQLRALATVERYVVAQLGADVEGMVAVTYPRWVTAQGGRSVLLATKRENLARFAIYQLDPEFVELGRADIVSARGAMFAVIPARSLTLGFPENIEDRFAYLAISEDQGATWKVLEMSCAGAQWVKETFAPYPEAEISRAAAEPFHAVSTLRPPRTSQRAYPSTSSGSTQR